jgi:NADPH:quinone reductase
LRGEFHGYNSCMTQATAEKMKAVAIDRFGGLDQLKTYELPKPEPKPDEVLIRVRAAGVGIWDSAQRQGNLTPDNPQFPLILGAECSGDIERLGSNVSTLKEGEPVYTYFTGKQGAYARYVAVKADMVARKPTSLSYTEAGGVPVDGITAHQSVVDELQVKPGEWFFVAGGAGGVGSMAVQIAANIGAKVIASAQAEDFGMLESLGVMRDCLIDYTKSDVVAVVKKITGGKGADAALDAVGGTNAKQTIEAVREGGRFAELTEQDMPGERGIKIAHVRSKPSATRLDALRDLIDAGKLKIHIGQTFQLAQAREAQAAVERPHDGKIVLTVD